MYDIIKLFNTMAVKYYNETGKWADIYLLQRLLYFCQIEYMRRYDGKQLFIDEFLCCPDGPLIRNLSKQSKCGSLVKDPHVLDIMDTVLSSFPKEMLLESIKISDFITNNPNSAWSLQKEEDQGAKQQPIKLEYLKKEAMVEKKSNTTKVQNIIVAHTIIDEYHKKLGIYPCSWVLQLLVYYCELAYMKRHNFKRLYDVEYFFDEARIYQKDIMELFFPFASRPIEIPDDYIKHIRSNDKEIVQIVRAVLDSVPPQFLTEYGKWMAEIKKDPNSAWSLQKKEMKEMSCRKENVPVRLKYLKKEAEIK